MIVTNTIRSKCSSWWKWNHNWIKQKWSWGLVEIQCIWNILLKYINLLNIGCPDSLIASMKPAAVDSKKTSIVKNDTATDDDDKTSQEDNYVLTLSRSLMEPFLTFSSQRHLREKGKKWNMLRHLFIYIALFYMVHDPPYNIHFKHSIVFFITINYQWHNII